MRLGDAIGGLLKWLQLDPADFRATTVLVTSTFLLVVARYHTIRDPATTALLLYFLAPLAIILFVLREHPRQFGLSLGNWRLGLSYVLGGAALLIVPILLAARLPSFRVYYLETYFPEQGSLHPLLLILTNGLLLFSWEFLFRGFLLMGLWEKFGYYAILIQMVPFSLTHLGKPEIEALSSIVGGILVGHVALTSRSFWPAFLIHWYLDLATMAVIRLGTG